MTRCQQLILYNEEYRCHPSKEVYHLRPCDQVPPNPLVEEPKHMHLKAYRVTDPDHDLQTCLNDRPSNPSQQYHAHHDQIANSDIDPEIDLIEFNLFSLFQVVFRDILLVIFMLHQFIIILLFESKHSSTYKFIYTYLDPFVYKQSKQGYQVYNPKRVWNKQNAQKTYIEYNSNDLDSLCNQSLHLLYLQPLHLNLQPTFNLIKDLIPIHLSQFQTSTLFSH